jgi:hypothetical protein
MNKRTALAIFLIGTITLLTIVEFWRLSLENSSTTSVAASPDVYVGVEVAYDNVDSCKKTIDKVKDYTNTFVVGDTGITLNETKLNQVLQYAHDAGLNFIPFMWPTRRWSDQPQWIAEAKASWGNHFLGIYAWDEAGGRQVDQGVAMPVPQADNYTDAANKYIDILSETIKHYSTYYLNTAAAGLKLFTADYALYWFSYLAGYDGIFAEFGWNHSRPLNVALCRGAASVQGKEWGVIITWTYRQPPYIESPDELYYDMIYAYLTGAKYIIIFSYPEVSTYGILTEAHFDAIKKFWDYIQTNPRTPGKTERRIAYVMPKDYGWAFRGSLDKVWGLWVDELSTKIGTDIDYLLHTHHLGLDIIYDDPRYYNNMTSLYYKLMFWNRTIIEHP